MAKKTKCVKVEIKNVESGTRERLVRVFAQKTFDCCTLEIMEEKGINPESLWEMVVNHAIVTALENMIADREMQTWIQGLKQTKKVKKNAKRSRK